MTTTVKAFSIAASVITVVVLQSYKNEMESINKKFEFQKDSTYQVMSKIMLFTDSIKSKSKPRIIQNEPTVDDMVLNFSTK